MCNPSLADSLPSPPSYSKNHYFSARLRRPSLRSMAGAGPTLVQGQGCSPSSDEEEQAQHFLDSCFLCRARLHVGDDIYMYRGDTPFCSEECRQEQIQMDEAQERERKKKMLSKKKLSCDDSANKSREIHVRAAADFTVVYVAV